MSDEMITVPMSIGSGGVPMGQTYSDRADIIDKIKPETMVEVIRQRLLGKEFIKMEWVEVKALRDRKLSEVGAWEIANLMLGVSSINISISKFKDREIKDRAFYIAKSAQRMMLSNWREYGIHNVAQLYYVHEIIFSNTLAVLKQADAASIQDLLKGTTRGHVGDYGLGSPKESTGRRIGRMLGLTQ